MIRVIGLRFRENGKIYYFNPGDTEYNPGEGVIVETVRGQEFGIVAEHSQMVDEGGIVSTLKPIIRAATAEDLRTVEENREKENKAFEACLEKIKIHGLEMKLVKVECTFDESKIIFYFTADGRIDFRELVKDLASVFKTRIEMRQIGARDESKTLGGYGICGRELCCYSWQKEFVPVSIKMAKNQNLSLNPGKISGNCGRLMCCIKYEEEAYFELNKNLPKPGYETVTEDGYYGVVDTVNVLKQRIRVIVDVGDEKEAREYGPDELKFTKKKKKSHAGKKHEDEEAVTEKEMEELEALEKDD